METVNEKPSYAQRPVWIPIVQGLAALLSVVILGLSAYLVHGKYFDTLGYDIFCVCFLNPSSLHLLTNT